MPHIRTKKDNSKKLNNIKIEVNFKRPVLYEQTRKFFALLALPEHWILKKNLQ
jgi:hypothetical protein